jgi:hypothetical protein
MAAKLRAGHSDQSGKEDDMPCAFMILLLATAAASSTVPAQLDAILKDYGRTAGRLLKRLVRRALASLCLVLDVTGHRALPMIFVTHAVRSSVTIRGSLWYSSR